MADDSYERIMTGPIPDGPLFPDGIGGVLHAVLNPQPQNGPPYVHTFRPPEPEYDENGDPYWPLEPSFTITETGERRLNAISFVRADQLIDLNCRFAIMPRRESGDD